MKYAHLSIDDTEAFFIDIIQNNANYKHLTDNRLVSYLYSLHNRFGACFTLYGYTKIGQYHISDVPTKFKSEFEQFSSWLAFGFHWSSADYDSNLDDESVLEDCNEFYRAVASFAGKDSISSTLRLHYFHCSSTLYDKLCQLKPFANGLTLLSPDTPGRTCYDLNDSELKKLYSESQICKKGRKYVCTTIRVENNRHCTAYNDFVSVFTHEWLLVDYGFRATLSGLIKQRLLPSFIIKRRLRNIVRTLNHKGYRFIV